MRRNALVSIAALSLVAAACSRESTSAPRSSASDSPFSVEASAKRRDARVKELKGSILAFAKIATDRRQADEGSVAASRLYMSSLITDLREVAPAMAFEAKLGKTVGVWQEVWSDEQNPLPPGFQILRPNVFQIVRADGIGFNIGVRSTPGGVGTAIIQLEATADLKKERTDVVFTKTFFKPGDLSSEASLSALGQGLVDGTRPDVAALPESRFPRGPVGARGTLETVYVDDEMRISQGPNAFSGVVDTFVLVRVREGEKAAAAKAK